MKVVEKWQTQGGPYLPRDLTEQQKAELASYIGQAIAQAVQAERERHTGGRADEFGIHVTCRSCAEALRARPTEPTGQG